MDGGLDLVESRSKKGTKVTWHKRGHDIRSAHAHCCTWGNPLQSRWAAQPCSKFVSGSMMRLFLRITAVLFY